MFASRIPFISGLFVNSHQAWVILAGAVLICLLGVADDLWDLDWMLKLAGQLLISVFVAWGGLQIISLPLGSLVTASPMISMAITAFLIVASINAVNFVDGLDALASGIVAIGGIAFAIYSYILARSSPNYASMATLLDVALVGICVGFILHNWHPAKLFMGDSGSMLLGYLITCASIVMTGHLDPASVHTSVYLPAFMPILLPVLVLFPAGARHDSGHRASPEQGPVAHAPRPHAPASSHAAHRPLGAGRRADSVGLGRTDLLRLNYDSVLPGALRRHRHDCGKPDPDGIHDAAPISCGDCRNAVISAEGSRAPEHARRAGEHAAAEERPAASGRKCCGCAGR
jgi:UDP-GlcNAc:undecaprenyl-phosphate GlcNAc-1-phosphate transferase